MTAYMKRIIALLLLTVIPLSPALAWWEYGHQTVAQIAKANMTKSAKQQMRILLKSAALLDTPKCPLRSIEDASTWADCIKNDQAKWGYANAWHYQNVNICKPFDLATSCADGNCVSAQIDRNTAALKDRSLPAQDRLKAMAFLIHFVGDLHQPLHAGDRSDKGGNEVKARYGIMPPSNLHAIWDGRIAERGITDGPNLVRRYSRHVARNLGAGTSAQWSEESWKISRDIAYTTALDGDPCGPKPTAAVTIDDADMAASREALRLQIQRGGLRLARLLNAALG
jgi:S1/P1 Nuclease